MQVRNLKSYFLLQLSQQFIILYVCNKNIDINQNTEYIVKKNIVVINYLFAMKAN